MFGSVVVADYIYKALGAITGITSVIPKPQMVGTMVVPQGVPLPAILFHMTYSEHGGPINTFASAHTNSETLRVEVRVLAESTSDSVIYPIAKAQFTRLAGVNETHTFDGATWNVSFIAVSEIPLTTLMDGSTIYRQLGTIYSVDVFRA